MAGLCESIFALFILSGIIICFWEGFKWVFWTLPKRQKEREEEFWKGRREFFIKIMGDYRKKSGKK